MADALRYLTNTAEATTYQPEPCGNVTSAKLTQACDDAEDAVDAYLAQHGCTTPLTLASFDDTQQDLLKRATAKMVAAILFSQHNMTMEHAKQVRLDAEGLLDEFRAHVPTTLLGSPSTDYRLGVVNAQEEYVTDWNEPNESFENADE